MSSVGVSGQLVEGMIWAVGENLAGLAPSEWLCRRKMSHSGTIYGISAAGQRLGPIPWVMSRASMSKKGVLALARAGSLQFPAAAHPRP